MIEIKPSDNGSYSFEDLLAIVEALRSDEGCPWDREQDHESVKLAAVEEAYELVEAINNGDTANMTEELGDLLLQVIFHSQMASEAGTFRINHVIDGIASKLIYRHPYVFATEEVADSEEVLKNWDELKLKEKDIQSHSENLKQVPKAFPALLRAKKVQKKAAKAGMEFENTEQVLEKVQEELDELKVSLTKGCKHAVEEEFGDLLFSMVNLSRFLAINPENSLTNAVEKFITRFEGVENLAKASNRELSAMSAATLDELWEAVKTSNNRENDC